jgi:hypothetical protein
MYRLTHLYIPGNQDEETRAKKGRVKRNEPTVLIIRVSCEILANDLAVSRIANRTKKIDGDYFIQSAT